jgi:chromosome segregation and condensation protein ScpB
VREGRLHLKRPDALEIPERVKQIKRVIETSLPHVRIEDLLQEVDRVCGFTRELRPLSGYEPRGGNLYQTLLAALIAHGTNLGIAAMAHSVEEITVDLLQYVSQMFLSEITLKTANATLVDYHHRLQLSSKILAAYLSEQGTASGNLEMTTATLEVLACIAVKQPISQAEIDQVFDVDKRGLVVKLRDLKLAEEFAGADGRPRFATTEAFLQRFGLASLGELTAASLSDKATAIEPLI